jgi:hypothetical protein
LEVSVSGGKYWRWKYRIGGKEKRLAFGVLSRRHLKSARRSGIPPANGSVLELIQATPGKQKKYRRLTRKVWK